MIKHRSTNFQNSYRYLIILSSWCQFKFTVLLNFSAFPSYPCHFQHNYLHVTTVMCINMYVPCCLLIHLVNFVHFHSDIVILEHCGWQWCWMFENSLEKNVAFKHEAVICTRYVRHLTTDLTHMVRHWISVTVWGVWQCLHHIPNTDCIQGYHHCLKVICYIFLVLLYNYSFFECKIAVSGTNCNADNIMVRLFLLILSEFLFQNGNISTVFPNGSEHGGKIMH